ncbi:MAG: biotin--[acetyl-CoA-carboxylase] ligase [Pseudomonadota bacterium]
MARSRLPSGAAVDLFDSLDSTSLEAKRRLAAGAEGPEWVVALKQTAGYGRRARAWEQASGDFAGTLFFRPRAPLSVFGQLSFVVALAVRDALGALGAGASISLKWPNDVLADGGKVSGILLETAETEAGVAIVIGVGVNIVSKPEGLAYRAARLMDSIAGAPPAPAVVAEAIDAQFWPRYDAWARDGFGGVREAWLSCARGLGEAITVRLPSETVTGVFDGIDETGALILRNGRQKRIIGAGDVFFGRPPEVL